MFCTVPVIWSDASSHFAIKLINKALCWSINTRYHQSECVFFCAVPCSSVTANRIRYSHRSLPTFIHHVTDLIWDIVSLLGRPFRPWQTCSSQRRRGLVSLWKGHGSSEAHHLIRRETCHEMKVITSVLPDVMRMALTSRRSDWFNAVEWTGDALSVTVCLKCWLHPDLAT